MDLRDQLLLEDDLVLQGKDRYMKSTQSAQDQGRSSDTDYGQRLLSTLITPVASLLQEFCDSPAAKHGKFKTLLRPLDHNTTAFIALKAVLNSLHKERTVTQVALDIGMYIEDEQRFAAFKDINPEYYSVIMKDFSRKNTKAYRHMRNVLAVTSKKKGVEWTLWTKEMRLGIGAAILDQIIKGTDLIRVARRKRRKGYTLLVVPTTQAIEWIEGYHGYASLLHPYTKPCIIPPDNWTSVTSGGYWSEAMRHRNPLIKGLTEHEQTFVQDHDLRRVYDAVNSVQRTAWCINAPVLEVMKSMWVNNNPVGLPKKEPMVIPKFRVDTPPKEMDEATFKEFLEWKVQVAQMYTDEVSRSSRAYEVARVLGMASTYSKYPSIWFVYQCDFRGRLYVSSSGLNPQGTDFNKAMLQFAEGKALGQNGLYWLAVHGANTYGVDKVSFDDRVDWVTANLDQIQAVRESPLDTVDFWGNADHPYMFLAFCLEYAQAVLSPEGFISHLPIGMDGSCNGLQNFSALLRDEVGGKATNLLPSDTPADIYQEVADQSLENIRKAEPSKERTLWLAFADKHKGIPRSIAKRPVMTLPYGCTKYSCFGFVTEAVRELDEEFFEDLNKASTYMTNILWNSIEEVVVSARVAMQWLQDIAKITAERNLPVWWVNPVGFPVYQAVRKKTSKQIRTMLMGNTRLCLNTDTRTISPEKQVQGVAPNFVHSLDSAHMMLTINDAVQQGITNFAMIHDDFGTHAADVEAFRDTIRSCFVSMYKDNTPLNDLYLTTSLAMPDGEVPPLPDYGTLDLTNILDSEYFFA